MKKKINNEFQDLIDIWSLIIESKKCFWSNDQNILSILPCISSEIEELKEAIKTYDCEEIMSEIGDILGLSIMLCFLAERDGICSISNIVKDQCDKIKRRAAYIFDPALSEKITSRKEAEQQWIKVKNIEKKNKKVNSLKKDIIVNMCNVLEKKEEKTLHNEE